jgi:pantetheine-phosphate adenylyltransferase
MKSAALYPGTFDPITNGHHDLIRRAVNVFGRVVVGVASNPGKAPLFTLSERVGLASEVLSDLDSVEVVGYDGLTVEFARANGIHVMIRGLRAVSDFEFEFQLATMSRQIAPEVESVFLTPAAEFSFISSSMVREIGLFGGDIRDFVHPSVEAAIRDRAVAMGR